MVTVAFFNDFISVGFFFYSYGLFFLALANDFGGSHLGLSVGFMLSNAMGAVMAPFLGQALDRLDIKWIMVSGAVSLSIGYALLSQINSLWQFYLILGTFLAFGSSAMGGQSSSKLVANWFHRRRGLALGVATMGISASGIVMPGIAAWLIGMVGWRGGYLVYAIAALALVTPVVLLYARTSPESVGQFPDGVAPRPTTSDQPVTVESAFTSRMILSSGDFWFTALTFAILVGVFQAVLVHMVPQLTSQGLGAGHAAAVLSLSAGLGVLGKLVFGWLTDLNEPRIAVWLCIGTQLVGAWMLMSFSSLSWLLLAGAVFGFGMGGVVPLQSSVIGQVFGRLSFGRAVGLLRPAMLPLQVIPVPLAGWIYDLTGTYRLSYIVLMLALVFAAFSIAMVRIPQPE